jgi:hypothetical protein
MDMTRQLHALWKDAGAPQFAGTLLKREEYHVLHGNEPQYPYDDNKQMHYLLLIYFNN